MQSYSLVIWFLANYKFQLVSVCLGTHSLMVIRLEDIKIDVVNVNDCQK